MPKPTLFIASPLEPGHVERIRAAEPKRLEVLYEPDLLPPTRYVGDHAGAPFRRTPAQEARWADALAAADILWDLPRTAGEVALARRLRWVQTTSTGVGRRVLELGLRESDVIVTTARGVHAGPLAEFVAMALLAHFRGLRHLQEEQRQRRWTRTCGEEVAGRTLVTIGAGDLARGTARIARALDMRVLAVTRDPSRVRAHGDLFDAVHDTARLHEALGQADAVVVTVPHTAETEHLIDAAAFAAMRTGVALVNIGRGIVVDEPSLVEALRSGKVGYAALDVTDVEPLPSDSPLWDMPNVLISPHSASTVSSENGRIVDILLHNLRCYLDGDVAGMRNVLDKVTLY